MPQLQELAHFRTGELNPRAVSLDSPLEEQVRVVYEAARRYAQVKGFEPSFLKGRSGLKGQMVMKQLLRDLFLTTSTSVEEEKFDRISKIIPQVLKKTGGAVCLFKPENMSSKPTYFIANELPDNIVPVVLNMNNKSATQRLQAFNEDAYLNRTERRLSSDEAGETQLPGEITVTMTETTPQPAHLAKGTSIQKEKSRLLRERVLDEIRTNPVPLTARDITTLINKDGFDNAVSTIRDILIELTSAGEIVGRQETAHEALLRGGGRAPISHRPKLYVAAPGPVPKRRKLPVGITPDATTAKDVVKRTAEAKAQEPVNAVLAAVAAENSTQRLVSPVKSSSVEEAMGQLSAAMKAIGEAVKDEAANAEAASKVVDLEERLAVAEARALRAESQVAALKAAIASLA